MTTLKIIHLSTALISILGFIVRGYWRLTGSPKIKRKFVRIAPHVIDTILLVSAVLLMLQVQQYPFVHSWLTAKVIALFVYILLGMMTMRIAKHTATRFLAYCAAIITFIYIIAVALTHSVIPVL